MKLLAIATGTSFQELGHKLSRLDQDIRTIGVHRVFPYIKEVHDIDLDYWTWADPNAVTDGLDYIEKNPNVKVPHIIIPTWLKTLDRFNKEAGTSPINREPAKVKQYEEGVSKLYREGKLTFIEKSINSRVLTEQGEVETITNPEKRFDGNQIVFGTVPYDGRIAESQWGRENKFTFNIMPTATFMEAKEVYCLGFDNRGGRISSPPGHDQMNHNNESIIRDYLNKFKPWSNEWKSYHGIDIYSVAPDKFTPNNTVLKYKQIEDLLV
tara:strand:- start:1132 stop:1932 length:801 start_codon:yes stop_codon:yes gene_type:complete